MKKTRVITPVVGTLLFLSGCGANGQSVADDNSNNTPVVELNFTQDKELSGFLSVSTFDSMMTGPFVEEAAKLFMDKHPEVEIEVSSFSAPPNIVSAGGGVMVSQSMDNMAEKIDYINGINTELMSGRGADIIAMEILPFYNYAQNGQLVNLEAYMNADPSFDKSNYRAEILDAIRLDDGLYMFPLDYSFNYVTYDSSVFTDGLGISSDKLTYDQLIDLGAAYTSAENTYVLPLFAGPVPGLFAEMFNVDYDYYADILGRNANFTGGRFESLIEQVMNYEKEGYIRTRDDNMGPMPMLSMEERQEMLMADHFLFDRRSSAQLLGEFYETTGMGMRVASMTAESQYDEIAGLIANEDGEVTFSLGSAFGINENSQEKELAWEFIKFLADEAMGESMRVRGLPTNISVFEERTKMSIAGVGFAPMMMPGMAGAGPIKQDGPGEGKMPMPEPVEKPEFIELDATQQQAYDAYIAQVETFTKMLNKYTITDTMVEDIIRTEVKEVFDGNKSASDAANVIQNRVGLFLNE